MFRTAVSPFVSGDQRDRRPEPAVEELFEHPERVRLVEWAAASGPKTSVVLSATVAVLAFITGLSDLSATTVSLAGPLGGLFPGATGLVRLYGVFFAFLIGAVTVGLRRRLRLAWYGAVLALPLAALLPLLTADPTDVPLFAAAVLAVGHVLVNREEFDRAVDLTAFQTAALVAFLAVQVYGTVGTYALREEFVGVESATDAVYYIVVTGTTVGYGDATPTTQLTKLFTLSVIVLGTGSFTVATGSLLVPAIESRISSAFGNMNASELSLLEDHVLVLGHGDVTEPLLEELRGTTDLVVVTADTETAAGLREDGVNVVTADPTDAEALRGARIADAAGVVVATADDANDVLAVLAARQANPDVRIVAAATDRRHVDKLENVGADRVITPTVIGGRLLGRAVMDGTGNPVEDALAESADAADAADADAADGR
ncbi:potassium channel protein [haloarchaeon 3A1-DGR]|nr:potassium channel protein [haloarchaeon 3A1-DGR]